MVCLGSETIKKNILTLIAIIIFLIVIFSFLFFANDNLVLFETEPACLSYLGEGDVESGMQHAFESGGGMDDGFFKWVSIGGYCETINDCYVIAGAAKCMPENSCSNTRLACSNNKCVGQTVFQLEVVCV